LKSGDNVITQPQCIADEFADHFAALFKTSSSVDILNNLHFILSDFLNVPSISNSDVKKAIRCLILSKCVGPDEISSSIIKGCSDIFAPVLRHIFNISLLQGKYLILWKQAVVPALKKGNSALINDYRPITVLNNFSKICENIIHDQLTLFLL
jgi:hypothetical protein